MTHYAKPTLNFHYVMECSSKHCFKITSQFAFDTESHSLLKFKHINFAISLRKDSSRRKLIFSFECHQLRALPIRTPLPHFPKQSSLRGCGVEAGPVGAVDISIAHRGLCSSCVNISAWSDSPLSRLSYTQGLVWIKTSCLL